MPPSLTAEAVSAELRSRVVRGRYPPGSVLSQVQLATELGVSRTTVREGLRMLQQDGLVEARFNHRVRIVRVTPADLDEIYAMIIPLDATAIRIAVPRLDAATLDEAAARLAEIDALGVPPDPDAWVEPHRAFHRLVVAPAGPRFRQALDQLGDHASCFGAARAVDDPAVWRASAAQHRAILDACRTGDADLASVRLAHHHAWSAVTVLAITAPGHVPAAVHDALQLATHGADPAWPGPDPAG